MEHADVVVANLLVRAREGDREVLGSLLDAHRDYLKRIAEQQLNPKLGARIDASDLVQQTCLSVHKHFADFDGQHPAQFVAWLRQVHERNIRNACRDQLHSRKRSADREEPLAERDLEAARQSTPSQHAVRGEAAARLAAALVQLPDDERQALRLRFLEGQTLAQVCRQLGLTKDALAWLMKRALNTLRQVLSEEQR